LKFWRGGVVTPLGVGGTKGRVEARNGKAERRKKKKKKR
jgi:hypothetical protein